MESVDGARLVQTASDEIRNQCDPCKYDGNEKTAVKFCQECKEHLCKDCTDSHKRVTVTRNHRIVSAELILGQASEGSTSCKILCESCNTEEVKDFCEQHQSVICQACKTVKHRKCNTTTIKKEGKSYSRTKIGKIENQLRKTETNLERLLEDRNTDLQKLKDSTDSCITEIRSFREEINSFLDLLEENIIKESDKKASQERHHIELHSSTVSTTLQMLKADLKLLDDSQKSSINDNMFAADIKVSNNLREYEQLLLDIYAESKSPVITFKKNELLSNMKNKTNDLGSIEVNYVQTRPFEHKLFPDMSVLSSSQVYVKLCEEKYIPTITGCDVLPDGQIILCDRANGKVKLLHSSFTLKESLKLKSFPFDVSVINNSSAVITVYSLKQLQYIELEPSLKCGRVIQLDKKCFGVQVVDETLYITLHNNPGQGEVRILGLEGNLKKRIGANQDGSFMFTGPDYLTVSSSSGRIYISDPGTTAVTCIKPGGSVVYKYLDTNLKCPTGLCVDAVENLIVCDRVSNNVQIITPSGKMSLILLTANDGVKTPLSLAYRHTDNALIVGCESLNYLLLYHLT